MKPRYHGRFIITDFQHRRKTALWFWAIRRDFSPRPEEIFVLIGALIEAIAFAIRGCNNKIIMRCSNNQSVSLLLAIPPL